MTPESPPEEVIIPHCGSCDAPYDAGDNFCRRCGDSLNDASLPAEEVTLPAVPNPHYEPVPWRPAVPPVVQGAAVLVAGTLTEMVLRGLASRVLRTGARLVVRRPQDDRRRTELVKADPDEQPADGDAQIVSETWFFRRVRVRR